MFIKRIAIGAIGLALPLTLVGAPAYASGGHGYDDDPEIKITDVDFKHGKFVVDVAYECEDDKAKIVVKLKLGHNTYRGSDKVDCDDEDSESITLYGHGKVKSGYGYVEAEIEDEDGDTADDDARIKVKVRGGHDHH